MLDLYERKSASVDYPNLKIIKHVASISFKDVVRDFGVKAFFDIQRLLDRLVIAREKDETDDSASMRHLGNH
jgi:hypothetical protein